MKQATKFLYSVGAAALAIGSTGAAQARHIATDAPPAAAADEAATQDQAATPDDTQSDGLAEIVVTAQRRSENLQKVPVAVTAIDGEQLTARGIADMSSLTTATPGLQYNSTTSIGIIYLRGVGTENLGLGDEPSVATYVDGVYYPSAYGSDTALPDVERVEVLKGPQGTLFGRNAAGGVINVTTLAPSHTTKLNASIGYGSYETLDANLYASTGITDTLAASVTAYYHDQNDGYGRNLTTGADIFKSTVQFYRTKWQWEPTAGTKITVGAYYSSLVGDLGHDRRPIEGAVMIGGTTYKGFYNVQNTFNGVQRMFRKGANLNIEQDLGGIRLVAIGSLQKIKNTGRLDQDGTPVAAVDFSYNDTTTNTKTAELQLLSAPDSKLKWIAGLYYFNDTSSYNPLEVVGAFKRYITQYSHSYAGFAQASYPLTDSLNFTGGLRYTSDTRRRAGYGTNAANVVTQPFRSEEKTFSKLTWRASLDYQISERVLAYASYNRGFKSGIFNTVNLIDPAAKPEVIDAFEIGVKSQTADRKLRLNVSTYYYTHKDIQAAQFTNIGGVTNLFLFNAAKGEYYGAEIEAEAAPTDGLRIQAGVSMEHARYKSFPGAPQFTPIRPAGGNTQTPGDASGNHIIRTPDFTANLGATYETQVAGGTGYLNASYYYNDGFYWKPDNRVRQEAYNLVNGKIGWRSPDDTYDISIWGKNIFSAKYYIYENEDTFGDSGSPAAPGTYGVTFRVKFGSQ